MMINWLRTFTLTGILLFIGVAALQASVPDLPDDGFASNWQKTPHTYKQFTAANLYGYIDGGAELFLEYGFTELRVQQYTNGQQEVMLEVYEMESPDAALGIYLAKAGRETPDPDLAARNTSSPTQVLAVKNRWYVKAISYSRTEDLQSVLVALVNHFTTQVEATTNSTLLTLLPTKGLIPGSARLVRGEFSLQPFYTFGEGDILQLEGATFGVTGRYESDSGDTYSRLIIDYSSNTQARLAFDNLVANLDPYLEVMSSDRNRIVFRDWNNEYGEATRTDQQIEIKVQLDVQPE